MSLSELSERIQICTRKEKTFVELNGRTVCPIALEFRTSPQSCPPDTEANFITPERPAKGRRPLSETSNFSFESLPSFKSPSSSVDSVCDVTANLELHSCTESNQCPHCLFTFNNGISFKQHQCMFKINTDLNTNHVVLKRPKNWKETLTIVRQLCEEDVVKLCILNNWCLPEFYPFCFPHQIRSGRTGTIPLLETMTASKHSANCWRWMK